MMITLSTFLIMSLLLLLVLTPVTLTFAQEQDLSNIFGGGDVVTFDELSPEDLKPVLDYVVRDILNNTIDIYLHLYPDGTMRLNDYRGTHTFYDDVSIQAYHNFTPANG